MKWAINVSKAAGAIAAPMLLASLIPISITLPVVIYVTYGPFPHFERIAEPAPVTVHWDVGGLWFPSSSGNLNCFSALQKWLDADAIHLSAAPPSIKIDESCIPSTKVEQAPNMPYKGIPSSLKPKLEDIHWLSKSPAKQ